MSLSVRLDEEGERAVSRLAHSLGRSKSEVVRDAIAAYAEQHPPATSVYSLVESLIGCMDSGGAQLSQHTGQKFTKLLQEKRRGRRSR